MSSAAAVTNAPAGAAAGEAGGEQRQQNPLQNLAALVLRMGVMYAFMVYMRGGKKDEAALDRQGTGQLNEHNSPFSLEE